MKFYQPQLPFDIDLKEPLLEQYCRLTFDPELYFNPEAMPVYMKQPMAMPGETTYREQVKAETSPLQRLVPGYESYKALSVLFEAAFARALDEQHGYQPGEIYIPCWFVWPDIVFVPVFPQRIQCGGLVPITACRMMNF